MSAAEIVEENVEMIERPDGLRIYRNPKRQRWLDIRKGYCTSTEMAPICGIPKYGNTRWSIYMQKIGKLDDSFEGNERTEAGVFIEHAIAKLAIKKVGCRAIRNRDFIARGRLGASFDYRFEQPGHELDGWNLECKNVDRLIYKDQWIDGQPPEHIVIQTQSQLEVSRAPGTVLAALVGGNTLELVYIARDEEMGANLRRVADDFWDDIQAGREPEVVGDDAENVGLLWSTGVAGSVHDARGDAHIEGMVARYFELGREEKILKDQRDQIKAQLLLEIKDAAKVVCNGFSVDAGNTAPSEGTLITAEMVGSYVGGRRGFRRFTVREKK